MSSATASSSASSGAGGVNCPRATPILSRATWRSIGTSLAAGRPLRAIVPGLLQTRPYMRAMMISVSAPVSNASTSRERCAFAWSMFTVDIPPP